MPSSWQLPHGLFGVPVVSLVGSHSGQAGVRGPPEELWSQPEGLMHTQEEFKTDTGDAAGGQMGPSELGQTRMFYMDVCISARTSGERRRLV